jgi:hypothetical protein
LEEVLALLRVRYLSTALLLVAAACTISHSAQRSVEIPGNAPVAEKLNIARDIATQVWDSGIKARIRETFPELTQQQADGLGLRWNATTFKSFTAKNREPQTSVVIQCVFSSPGNVKSADQIVQECEKEVKRALTARIGGAAA